MKIDFDVCVVGLGPAGLAAALTLAKHGLSDGLMCVEEGGLSDRRLCKLLRGEGCAQEEVCQVVSGIGGCFLLGGGKVSDYPAGSGLATVLGNERAAQALGSAIGLLGEYLPLEREAVWPDQVEEAQRYYSSLGFDYRYFEAYTFAPHEARLACSQMCDVIKAGGASVMHETQLERIQKSDSASILYLRHNGERTIIRAKTVVLAIGRSGRMLLRRVASDLGWQAVAGQLDIGVRIEFPSGLMINRVKAHQDLKLIFGEARTFCVCEDGRIAAYRVDGALFTEGSRAVKFRTGRTNLGILRRFRPSGRGPDLLEEIEVAAAKRGGRIMVQGLDEYLDGEVLPNRKAWPITLSASAVSHGSVASCFPSVEAPIRESVRYFADRMLPRDRWAEVLVSAPEVDYTGTAYAVAPDFSVEDGVYLVGDCTGLFRGIAQAFASGVLCAESLLRKP